MAKIIKGDEYGTALCTALGIDVHATPVRRIVLDVTVSEPIKVYVEYLGTDALLDVKLPANAVEIVSNATQ